MGRWAILGGAIYLAVGLIGAPTKPRLTSSTSPLASHSESRSHVHRAQYGDEWLLTVDAGELLCVRPNSVILRTSDGRAFALNGTAASRYPSIEPIWARDERLSELSGEDMRVSLGRLIAEGLALCGK
jgi:hypothetical protein